MRLLLFILGLAVVVTSACHSQAQRTPPSNNENIVMDAVVERIGKNPGFGSGVIAVYQLAKYRIVEVCTGEYTQPEIVVDHLLMTAKELNDLRVGDRVRLYIYRSKTIFSRRNEEGFRNATDEVSEFYVGDKPMPLSANCKPCEPCE